MNCPACGLPLDPGHTIHRGCARAAGAPPAPIVTSSVPAAELDTFPPPAAAPAAPVPAHRDRARDQLDLVATGLGLFLWIGIFGYGVGACAGTGEAVVLGRIEGSFWLFLLFVFSRFVYRIALYLRPCAGPT